jgi:archaellum component FlaC
MKLHNFNPLARLVEDIKNELERIEQELRDIARELERLEIFPVNSQKAKYK